MLFATLFFVTDFFSKGAAVFTFVCSAEAIGGLQRSRGGNVAGEVRAAVLAQLTRCRECGWGRWLSPTRFCVFGL